MAGSMRVKGGSKGDVKGKGKAKKSSAIAGPSRPAARVPEVVEQDEEKVELEEDAEEAVELEGDQEDDVSGSEDGDGEDDRDRSAKQTQEQLEHQDATASEEDAEDGASDEHDAEGDAEGDAEEDKPRATFESLGLIPQICQACSLLNFKFPSEIQAETIPYALQGKDIIGLAQTGSGKTAAFALPVIQALYNDPAPFFCCVLAPTRELAYQISEQFTALGSTIGVRCVVLVGGMDMMEQSIALGKRPHVIVATPGRLQDHLENTKGFSLRSLKYLVMDEADRLLDMDFGPAIDKILKVIPRERNTYLFSATMTTKVAKLQRASLSNPVKLEVSSKYSTVSTLIQHYLFIPLKHKDTYLVYLANELSGRTMIIFTRTVHDASRVALLLRHLGFPAIPLHGQLSQSHRLGALNKFKSGGRTILVATDVASRGLDIPLVDYVINYDIPTHSKDYIHRVGRTARAGRAGKSITLATQYDVELLQRIEGVIGKKMTEFPSDKEQVLMLAERVGEAQREAAKELRDENSRNGGKGRNGKRRAQDAHDDKDRDDDMVEAGGGGMKRRKVMNKRRR